MVGMGNLKDAWSLLKTAAVQLGLNQRRPAVKLNTCLLYRRSPRAYALLGWRDSRILLVCERTVICRQGAGGVSSENGIYSWLPSLQGC